MAFVLAVDGFGPFHGWLMFAAIMFLVVVVGGALGVIGRRMDLSQQADPGSGEGTQGR